MSGWNARRRRRWRCSRKGMKKVIVCHECGRNFREGPLTRAARVGMDPPLLPVCAGELSLMVKLQLLIPCIDHGGPFHLAQLRLWNWRLRKWTLLRSQCSEPPRITPLGCTNASHPALTPEGMSSLCCPYVFHKSLAKVKLQLRNSSNSASVSDSVDETAGQSFRDFVWELETGTRGTLLKC